MLLREAGSRGVSVRHVVGLFSIDGYVSLKDKTAEEVAELIRQRLEINRLSTA